MRKIEVAESRTNRRRKLLRWGAASVAARGTAQALIAGPTEAETRARDNRAGAFGCAERTLDRQHGGDRNTEVIRRPKHG